MVATIKRRKLLYQLVSPLHRTAGEEEVERRHKMLKAWAPGADVAIASPEAGPSTVESASDIAMVFPSLREDARRWREADFDAVVIGCFSDPAVDALSEVSGVGVIGPGEAGLLEAAELGEGFSILSSDPTPVGLRRRIRGMGLEAMFVSEVMVGCSVAQLVAEPERHFPNIVAQARGCRDAGADVIVLGCLAMCFVRDLPERLNEMLGIPVVNPVISGLHAANEIPLYRHPAGRAERVETRTAAKSKAWQ